MSTRSSVADSAVAVHTRSPQTIAEACPWPGISAFQIAPAGSQLVGTSCSMQVPSPRGPRQAGQNSALDVVAKFASSMAKARIRFMTSMISFWGECATDRKRRRSKDRVFNMLNTMMVHKFIEVHIIPSPKLVLKSGFRQNRWKSSESFSCLLR